MRHPTCTVLFIGCPAALDSGFQTPMARLDTEAACQRTDMDVGEKGKVKFISEECCEVCNEIEHNHFHCPVCGDEYAGTDIYGCGVSERFEDTPQFECEECGAEFRVLDQGELDLEDCSVVYEIECISGMAKIETRPLTTE